MGKLWDKIRVLLKEVEEYEHKRSILWLKYKNLLMEISIWPVKMVPRVDELNERVTKNTSEILEFFEPQIRRAFWKKWVEKFNKIFEKLFEKLFNRYFQFYSQKDIEDLFYKPPRLSAKKLRYYIVKLEKLIPLQMDLVRPRIFDKDGKEEDPGGLLVDITIPREYLGKQQPKISKLEWHSYMGEQKKAKKEREEKETELELEVANAKTRLQKAINYIRVRQNPKSKSVNESLITADAACLDFAAVLQECDAIKIQVAEMEDKGTEPEQIIGFIEEMIPEIESGYEESAKKIIKVELIHDELQDRLKQLGELLGEKTKTLENLEKASSILEDDIPKLWATRQTTQLRDKLEKIRALLVLAETEINTLSHWAGRIADLGVQILHIQKWEKLLTEEYEIVVERNKAFQRYLKLFDTKVLQLWANLNFEELEELLGKIETTLEKHKVKIGQKLIEIGEIASWETDTDTLQPTKKEDNFSQKMAEIARVGKEPLTQSHRTKSGIVIADELTGETVEVVTETGIQIRVDKSRKKQYEKIKKKHKEEQANKHTK